MTRTAPRRAQSRKRLQRYALVFVILACVVLAVILYFSFSRTTIVVTPAVQRLLLREHLTVGPEQAPVPAGDEDGATPPTNEEAPYDLVGRLVTTEVSVEQTFTDLTTTRVEPERVQGTVTIVNHASREQPLAAGTRLLSEDGVLFRTTERLDVPAGGSVTTVVLADEAGTQGAVAPGRFEIVALWEGLKAQIYGESTEAFTGGTRSVSVVSQENINEAQAAVIAQLSEEGAANIADLLADASASDGIVLGIRHDASEESVSAAVGDEVTSFTYAMTANVTAVVGSSELFDGLLRTLAEDELDDQTRLLGIETEGRTVTVRDVGAETGTATLDVLVPIRFAALATDPIFNPTNFLNRNEQDILNHFNQFDAVKSVEVRFSPFWVLRAPTLPDHISVELREPEEE